jgi:DNA-binding HxlR family transcriptional regulator
MRTRFTDQNCSVAQALEVLGDWWTLLVVREAFLGVRRFADLEANLGIAKNVLARRLDHLVAHGVLERVDAGVHGTRYEYQLTAMGKDLATIMTALRQWGDRWIFGEGHEPLLVLDRRTGRPVPRLRIVGDDGAPLGSRDIELRPGPGATRATRARARARRRRTRELDRG